MEPVAVAVNRKAVYQMEKMKERWKELGKIAEERGNVQAVKQKSENKDGNNAQREDCVRMIKCRVWNCTTRCMRLRSQIKKVQDEPQPVEKYGLKPDSNQLRPHRKGSGGQGQ